MIKIIKIPPVLSDIFLTNGPKGYHHGRIFLCQFTEVISYDEYRMLLEHPANKASIDNPRKTKSFGNCPDVQVKFTGVILEPGIINNGEVFSAFEKASQYHELKNSLDNLKKILL